MPHKLKPFITNIGFLELAIAAPSMKAAVERGVMSYNAFQHGFARQTDDPRIIAKERVFSAFRAAKGLVEARSLEGRTVPPECEGA